MFCWSVVGIFHPNMKHRNVGWQTTETCPWNSSTRADVFFMKHRTWPILFTVISIVAPKKAKNKSLFNQESVHLKSCFLHETHPKHIMFNFFFLQFRISPHLPLKKNSIPRYQQHQEPFLAVVVDPVRTCASGKVDIGAFRTYPAGHTPAAPRFFDGFLLEKKFISILVGDWHAGSGGEPKY